MTSKHLVWGTVLLASVCAWTTAAQQPAPKAAKTAPSSTASKPDAPSEGEQIFHRRCANCHNAPEGFSPRISGTVVRHMRVRASLSKREEDALLRFFNP